ncbi:hypothetical protein Tco_1004231 [Tanacetum coccineum]|uniref:Uncharacterized protein n=1 Tax=Tanacetum coccineum TaxID=301880 RepID=A0ABQ5FCL8_9ASTR
MQVKKQQARFGSAKPPQKKQSYDDHDSLRNREGEKKMKRRKGAGGLSSKKHKASANLSNFERFKNVDEPTQENKNHHDAFTRKHDNWFKQPSKKKTKELPEQSWFNELVDAKKDLGENELQIGSTTMFAKNMKNFLNKDKITKADFEGLVFKLLKNSPEGERFHIDLSKPLPLVGPSGRKTIPMRYFFNKDLSLNVMLRDNRLGYGNEGMKDRKWTRKGKERTKSMLEKIKKMLKERRRMRRLEHFVRGRRREINYTLLVRLE